MNQQEIERKWLMDGFPPLAMETESEMEQGYLCFEPSTVRIRKTVQKGKVAFWLTIKGKGTLQRAEVETPLQEEQYQALLDLLIAPPARKRLRTYRLEGGETLECSVVDEGEPTAFYYAEVEFENLQQAKNFVAPAYLGKEVTEQPGFSMAAYCQSKMKG